MRKASTRKFITRSLLAFGSLTLSMGAYAHPTSFKGSYALMLESSAKMTEVTTYYSPSHRFSTGLKADLEFTKDSERAGRLDSIALYPRLGLLIKRWNNPRSQGNLYSTIGYGAYRQGDSWSPSALLELEADWEDRRYYVSAKGSLKEKHNNSFEDSYTLRAGFAPYLGDMKDLNTWFILQTRVKPGDTVPLEITPLMRMFYNNVLFELGYSSKGYMQFNFMTHI